VSGFLTLPLQPDDAAMAIRGAYADRVAHGGVGHPVRGGFDELAAVDLLRLLGASRKSGRLSVHSGNAEGFVQLERGRVIQAVFGDRKGESALAPLFGLAQADFVYDPEALPQELPTLDQDLEVYARSLKKTREQAS
jgi:hypothetical protein